MVRAILDLGDGVQTSTVRASAMDVPGVNDAVESSAAGAVIVNVDELTSSTRDRLSRLPGVQAVYDDIQALPQVADEQEREDFLDRVRELGEDDGSAPLIETDPTRADEDDDLRTDGGGATVFPNEGQDPTPLGPSDVEGATEMVDYTGAPILHDEGITGSGVIAVVVDTGFCRDQFREGRWMDGADLTDEADPFNELSGHGTMSMGLMAGDENTEGIDRGMAPDCDLFPIKTSLAASELIEAQDIIVDLADETGRPVVVNNSWGFESCDGVCGHPVRNAIESAAGHPSVVQVFSAGNSGRTCGQGCDGASPGINGPNSLDNVITVGAAGRDGDPVEMQTYSSRGGPGQVACGSSKPDVTAPTFGTLPWSCGTRQMDNAGGTSSTGPLVAGSAVLMAEKAGGVSTEAVRQSLRETAEQFLEGSGNFNGCSGAGNFDAVAATDGVEGRSPGGPVQAGFGGTGTVVSVGLAAGLLGAILRDRGSP